MSLTFHKLRQTNVLRCVVDFQHPLNGWSVAEWGNATAGEVGEACNYAKKLLRVRRPYNVSDNIPEAQLKALLADEIADTVIYSDLWAASEGLDLETIVRNKFNRDSDKRGVPTKLLEA